MSETKKTRVRRTPEQIVADSKAQLERAKAKLARKQALSRPELAPLVDQLDSLKTDIQGAKRVLGSGAQSAETRRNKHLAWIEKIDAEEAAAQATLESAEARKVEIEAEIQKAVSELASEA